MEGTTLDSLSTKSATKSNDLQSAIVESVESVLMKTVEKEVLPQLVAKSEIVPSSTLPLTDGRSFVEAEQMIALSIDALVNAVVNDDRKSAVATINALIKADFSQARIMSDVFAAASSRLGDMWISDDVSFTDVTVGVGTLTILMRELWNGQTPEVASEPAKNALILSSHEEDHRFGTQMFCELLRLEGWQARHLVVHRLEEAEQAVATTPHCFIGVSLGFADNCEQWRYWLKRLRSRSCNPQTKVVVGGPGVSRLSAPARSLDADVTFYNGMSALPYVENIFQKQQLLSP